MAVRRAAGTLLALAACIACTAAAPTAGNHTALDLYDGPKEGCYYNFQHYGEGDRIMTNEPCLNCTCHNRMLMCYLRVCPFTKPIGQDCTVEKRADQCCPIVTCPDVPVDLLTSTSTSSPAEYGATGVGKFDKYGCSINGRYLPEGSKVPPTPNKPCEHCYCIRNMTTCVMQECTLHVDGCTPIYHKDVCCPVRYSCDHPEDEIPLLDDMTTTVRPTPGFLLTTTTLSPVTQMTQDCVHDDHIFPDGALIKTEKACEHCYCMKGDIVCVVQECGTPMENEGKNCTSLPPREGQCCPDTYICEGDELPTEFTTQIGLDESEFTSRPEDELTTLTPPRRVSVEGSGYRNEPDVPIYTETPIPEIEMEGSGDEEKSEKPISETSAPEIQTTVEEMVTSTETHKYTTSSELDIKTVTTEPDKGLNTVPIGISEDENVPTVPETSSERQQTTEPSIISDEQTTQISDTTDYQPTSEKDTSISRQDEFIITTEPTFRKEDEATVSSIYEQFTATTSKSEDKEYITSKDILPEITEEVTTSKITTKLLEDAEDVNKQPELTTESYLSYTTLTDVTPFEPITHKQPEVTYKQPEISTEATTVNPLVNEIDDDLTQHPGRIPGEGDCLLNGITYGNGSTVPNTSNCHSSCKCISSIIKCNPTICSPPPEYMDNCQPVYDTPDSCCPTYICDHAQETMPPQPHSQMSGTESPLPTPSIECNGDECQVHKEKDVPISTDKCSSDGDCLIGTSEQPETSECGPQGCGELPIPEYPVVVQPEKCTDDKCLPSSETCVGGDCEVASTKDKCKEEGSCEVSPIKPCEGEDCGIKPETDTKEHIKDIPHICENGEECQEGQTQPSHCEGELCKEIKVECKNSECIPHKVLPTETIKETSVCDDESGCKTPSEEECEGDNCRRKQIPETETKLPSECKNSECIPHKVLPTETIKGTSVCDDESGCKTPSEEECEGDNCRRKQIPETETKLPSECNDTECLQQQSTSSTEKSTDIKILSTELPIVEKITTIESEVTEIEKQVTEAPEKIEEPDKIKYLTTETLDLVTKLPDTTSDKITTDSASGLHPEKSDEEPTVSEQSVTTISFTEEPKYTTTKEETTGYPEKEQTEHETYETPKPVVETERPVSTVPASEQTKFDEHSTSDQSEVHTKPPSITDKETEISSTSHYEPDVDVTTGRPDHDVTTQSELEPSSTLETKIEDSVTESSPSERLDFETSTMKRSDLEEPVTEKHETEGPPSVQPDFDDDILKQPQGSTSETPSSFEAEDEKHVTVQHIVDATATEMPVTEILGAKQPEITMKPETEIKTEHSEPDTLASVKPEISSEYPKIETTSTESDIESVSTQQPDFATDELKTTTEQGLEIASSEKPELEIHTPGTEIKPEIYSPQQKSTQQPEIEQFEPTTTIPGKSEIETPHQETPLPDITVSEVEPEATTEHVKSGTIEPEQIERETNAPVQLEEEPITETIKSETATPDIAEFGTKTPEKLEPQTTSPAQQQSLTTGQVESETPTSEEIEYESSTPKQIEKEILPPKEFEISTLMPDIDRPDVESGTTAQEQFESETSSPPQSEGQTLAPEIPTPDFEYEKEKHEKPDFVTEMSEETTFPPKSHVTLQEPEKESTTISEITTERQLLSESPLSIDETKSSITEIESTSKIPTKEITESDDVATKLPEDSVTELMEGVTSIPRTTEFEKAATEYQGISDKELSETELPPVEGMSTVSVVQKDHTAEPHITDAHEVRTTISEGPIMEVSTKSPDYQITKSDEHLDIITDTPIPSVTMIKEPETKEDISTKLTEKAVIETEITTLSPVSNIPIETSSVTDKETSTRKVEPEEDEILSTESLITAQQEASTETSDQKASKTPPQFTTLQAFETKVPASETSVKHEEMTTGLPTLHISTITESVVKHKEGEVITELPKSPEALTEKPEISSTEPDEIGTEYPQYVTEAEEHVTKLPESLVTSEEEIHGETHVTAPPKAITVNYYDETKTESAESPTSETYELETEKEPSISEKEKVMTESPVSVTGPYDVSSVIPGHIDVKEGSTESSEKYSPAEEPQQTESSLSYDSEKDHAQTDIPSIKETETKPPVLDITEPVRTESPKPVSRTEEKEPSVIQKEDTVTQISMVDLSESPTTQREDIITKSPEIFKPNVSEPYFTIEEESTTKMITDEEIKTEQESVTESYTTSPEKELPSHVPKEDVLEVPRVTKIVSDIPGTEKYDTTESINLSSTERAQTITESTITAIIKEDIQTETPLITDHDINTELPDILTDEKIPTVTTGTIEISTHIPDISVSAEKENEPQVTTEQSVDYTTKPQEKLSTKSSEDHKTQLFETTTMIQDIIEFKEPEITTTLPKDNEFDNQDIDGTLKTTKSPLTFATEQELITKTQEPITDQAEIYTQTPEVMSHVTEKIEKSTEEPEIGTKVPETYITMSQSETTKTPDISVAFTKQDEPHLSPGISTNVPELDDTEPHKHTSEPPETPDIKQEIVTNLPVEIYTEPQEPVTKPQEVETDLSVTTKATEVHGTQEVHTEPAVIITESTSPQLPEPPITESLEVITMGQEAVTETPVSHTASQELITPSITEDQKLITEPHEGFTELPKEPESTSEPKYEYSETTPYLVELEEHTHKIEEETSTLSSEEIPTKYAELPTTQGILPVASTEKIATEKDILPEIPTKEDDEKKIFEPTEETSTPELDHTKASTEYSVPSEEEMKATTSISIDETKETKAPKPESFETQTDVVSSTELPLRTTSPEELIPVTMKATTITHEEEATSPVHDKFSKPTSDTMSSTSVPEVPKPGLNEIEPTDEIPLPEDGHMPPSGSGGYGQEPDYVEEDQAFGPGTCRYGGKVYVSAQQIPRDDPCDFCFCFRRDIICLQQSCPPPIHGCHEEPIQGFCCPRYECPVSMATTLNVTTTTTTTTTTLPPHFLPHAYKGAAHRRGCLIKGHSYKVGEVVRSSSGPCLHCTCGGDGQMKCDPKACTPEPMLRQMIAAAVSAKRRR